MYFELDDTDRTDTHTEKDISGPWAGHYTAAKNITEH